MPSSTTLQHAIENITIWRKGEQRAPHKPLLLLYVLSQYQRGHARMFDYASEIRDELHSLLERFGPAAPPVPAGYASLAPERRRLLGAATANSVQPRAADSRPAKSWSSATSPAALMSRILRYSTEIRS
jgi:hypothetical protein